MKSWCEASLPGEMAASTVMLREGINWAANSWLAMLVGPAPRLLLKFTSEIANLVSLQGFQIREDSKCI